MDSVKIDKLKELGKSIDLSLLYIYDGQFNINYSPFSYYVIGVVRDELCLLDDWHLEEDFRDPRTYKHPIPLSKAEKIRVFAVNNKIDMLALTTILNQSAKANKGLEIYSLSDLGINLFDIKQDVKYEKIAIDIDCDVVHDRITIASSKFTT